MSSADVVLWTPTAAAIIPTGASTPEQIAPCAKQLTKRDVDQIVRAYSAGSFEMMSSYVWSKAMVALKKQLATLGSDFIGEMLNRSDIVASTSVMDAITDYEAVCLAEDLGMVNATEGMRLKQCLQTIAHFASRDSDQDDGEQMSPEEAVRCLRSCIQSVLGHQQVAVATQFASFRRSLEERTLKATDTEVAEIVGSPYFFQRTTLSVVLALLRSTSGAQHEHAVGNVMVIVPALWPSLRKPEKWKTGQTYAELVSGGKKVAAIALKDALAKVQGFDYVPETLRSSVFTKAAKEVLAAHEGFGNFYSEPLPMRALAALGTTIPMPAFPSVMTAVLAVWLGNPYGHSFEAEVPATQVLSSLGTDRWRYYLTECLPGDRMILERLAWSDRPRKRWFELIGQFALDSIMIQNEELSVFVQRRDGNRTDIALTNAAKSLLNRLHHAAASR